MTIPRLTRRSLVRGALPAVVACVAGFVWARTVDAGQGGEPGAAANSYGPPEETTGERLAALADVPEHGGVVVPDANVVLVRDGDEVRGFSAVCTHQGCAVSEVTDGSIICPCHGSVFDASTGSPTAGPATAALAPVDVTVQGDDIVRG